MSVAFAPALLGALLGSFLNVVIWRLPRGESLVSPGSHCPSCGDAVKPYDNVPVVSWLILRGRCRPGGAPIPARYPLVEGLTAVLLALVPVLVGTGPRMWLGFVLVLLLVPVAFIDLDHRIIPNKLTLLGAVLGIVLTALLVPDALMAHLIAGAAGFSFLLI